MLRSHSWDPKSYAYKIAESSKPADEMTDLDQYVFVVRRRIGPDGNGLDKKTAGLTYYVGIKSEGL